MIRLPGWDGLPAASCRSIPEATTSVPQNGRLKALIGLQLMGLELDRHGLSLTVSQGDGQSVPCRRFQRLHVLDDTKDGAACPHRYTSFCPTDAREMSPGVRRIKTHLAQAVLIARPGGRQGAWP